MPASAIAIDPHREYTLLTAVYDEVDAWLDHPDALLFRSQPERSGWSPGQHLYHVAVATGGMLKAARLSAQGGGEAEHDGPNRMGRIVLEHERMPRGKAEAPAQVAPPEAITREGLKQAVARSRRSLSAMEEHLDAASDARGAFPHPFLGMLGAAEWLRVARVHARHHLTIVDELTADDA